MTAARAECLIGTRLLPLAGLAGVPGRAGRLAAVLEELLAGIAGYKGITAPRPRVIDWLRRDGQRRAATA